MAAPGYVWLLFPNPLNSTAIRQAQLQLVFAMKLKKVSVYHSIPWSHLKRHGPLSSNATVELWRRGRPRLQQLPLSDVHIMQRVQPVCVLSHCELFITHPSKNMWQYKARAVKANPWSFSVFCLVEIVSVIAFCDVLYYTGTTTYPEKKALFPLTASQPQLFKICYKLF